MLFSLRVRVAPAYREVAVSAPAKAARLVRGTCRAIAASLRERGCGISPETVPADQEKGAANARNFFAPSPFQRVKDGASCRTASEGQLFLLEEAISSADNGRGAVVFPPGSISASVPMLLGQSG